MRKGVGKKRTVRLNTGVRSDLDCHKWATKTEIYRLLSGKPELTIRKIPKPAT